MAKKATEMTHAELVRAAKRDLWAISAWAFKKKVKKKRKVGS